MTHDFDGQLQLDFWTSRLRSPCFVYIVRGEGTQSIKIGKAKDVKRRLGQLQVGNPVTLELLYVIPTDSARNAILVERNLHERADQDQVRGEWFAGSGAEMVLVIVEGLTRKMVEVHDGSPVPPSVWSILPTPTVEWWDKAEGLYASVDDYFNREFISTENREIREAHDEEAGIAVLGESFWPQIADRFMDHQPLPEIALELDISLGRLRRTMDAMRRGGYALDPKARRVRDPYGHESSRRWIRAS